jgi:membrane fusion protein
LFRAEAVAEHQDRWLGTVLVVPKLSHTVQTIVVTLLVAGILGLLAFGQYTRKARLGGFLVPETGLIEIVAAQGGTLTALPVREGQDIAAGTLLAVLSGERRSEALGATQEEVVRSLRERRDSLVAERERHGGLAQIQAEAKAARVVALRREVLDVEAEAELIRAQQTLAETMAKRLRDLRARGLTTESALYDAEKDLLDEGLALQQLARQRNALARDIREIEASLREAPLLADQKRAEIGRAIAAVDQDIAEAEAQREFVVTAPQPGTVTALRASVGGTLPPGSAMMTLVPAGTRLQAELYGPSSAIGFVRTGQRVLLRYEAYPHQKFGTYEGIVASVSRAPVAPVESLERPGLGTGAEMASDALYRVTVTLASQTARAYGEIAPLQPGMQLQADVLIETRRLYEWILDPLYSLNGRGNA